MKAELLTKQIRDVAAMVGELFDHDVEVVSIHIGPTSHPPTVRIEPGEYVDALRAQAQPNPYSGEHFVVRGSVEIAWIEPESIGRAARIAASIAQVDQMLERIG